MDSRESIKKIFCKCFDRVVLFKYCKFDIAEITNGSAIIDRRFYGTVVHYWNRGDEFIEQDIVGLREVFKWTFRKQ